MFARVRLVRHVVLRPGRFAVVAGPAIRPPARSPAAECTVLRHALAVRQMRLVRPIDVAERTLDRAASPHARIRLVRSSGSRRVRLNSRDQGDDHFLAFLDRLSDLRNRKPTRHRSPRYGIFDWLVMILLVDQAADDHAFAVVEHDVGFEFGRLLVRHLRESDRWPRSRLRAARASRTRLSRVIRGVMRQQHADLQELRRLGRLQLGGDRCLVAKVFADVDHRLLLIEHEDLGRAEGLGVVGCLQQLDDSVQIGAVDRREERRRGGRAGEADGLDVDLGAGDPRQGIEIHAVPFVSRERDLQDVGFDQHLPRRAIDLARCRPRRERSPRECLRRRSCRGCGDCRTDRSRRSSSCRSARGNW